TYAFSLSHEDGGGRGSSASGSASRAGAKQPAKKKANPNQAARQKPIARTDIAPMVSKMLDDRSRQVLELAVLAAAYARLPDLGPKIKKINAAGSVDLEGARLFYQARTDGKLDEKVVRRGLNARTKLDKRWTQLSHHLSSYDIRGNGMLYTLQAIAAAGDERFSAELHKLLDHADIRVRMEAATAIEHAGDLSSAPVLLKQLEPNPLWPVKVRLLSAIGAVPDKASIGPLIDMFRAEKGRFRQDVGYALSCITAGRHGKNIYDIYIWWQENEDTFAVDLAATRRYRKKTRIQDIKVNSLTTFYGLPIISDRVVFVLDTSASMKGEKIADLKSHMQDVLKDLPKHLLFNIVDFGGVINILRPGAMIEARYQYKVGELINDLSLTFGTRTFDAMEKAAELPRMDTIAYLSDGAPVGGQFNAWDRIIRTMDLYNRYRPIAIHTVHFRAGGKGAGKGAGKTGTARWMKELADRNAGWFTDSKDAGDENQ
ncbi:MAG: hypothetical protein OER86_13505, partial [Phycisphaerae bacterium]|nr:hypothetical protein [Phycisphaerae bacterium]